MYKTQSTIVSILKTIIHCIRLVPAFDLIYIRLVAGIHSNTIQKLIPITFEEYCQKNNGSICVIERPKERVVFEPEYFPSGKQHEHIFQSGPIYIAELQDVLVHGGTGLIISGNEVLTDICFADTENRVRYQFGPIRRGNNQTLYIEASRTISEIDHAISLCGLAASNYYHLSIEILSRFEYVRSRGFEATILLDESITMIPQCMELVECVIKDANIAFVPEFGRVFCKHLIYPSMNTWMPINVRSRYSFRLSDNLIAESAITNIRQASREYIKEQCGRKVFISRKKASSLRIRNEAEIVKLFEAQGFEIVCVEDLSYIEQIALFSSAVCIVGASGAALTNLIYCNSGTVFGCIIPKEYEFCIYSSIAHMGGCKVLFMDVKPQKHKLVRRKAVSAEQYTVNEIECAEYISRLEALMSESTRI